MNHKDKATFSELMAEIAATYREQLNKKLLKVYWSALEKYPFSLVARAFYSHVENPDNGQFMPKPADIMGILEGTYNFHALQAWSKVKAALKKVSTQATIVFDDPIIHAVITDMGGWIELGKASHNELIFLENKFEKRYCGYLKQKTLTFPKQLTGIDEYANQNNNRPVESPKLFGDANRALEVYKHGSELQQLPQYQITSLESSLKQLSHTKQLSPSPSQQENLIKKFENPYEQRIDVT
jgi:hypothetical protein